MKRSDFLVPIDCGHGIETPGKCSPACVAGLVNDPLWFREYQWARRAGIMVADLLYFEGVNVELIEKDEHDMPLKTRTTIINQLVKKWGKDRTLGLSIHNNAAGNGRQWMDARGWCVYTSPGVTESDKIASFMFEAAQEEFLDPNREYYKTFQFGGKQKPIRSDWSDGDPDCEACFWVLTKTNCPFVLVENFFQDNKLDVEFLKSEKGIASCANVMVEGILRYIDSKCA